MRAVEHRACHVQCRVSCTRVAVDRHTTAQTMAAVSCLLPPRVGTRRRTRTLILRAARGRDGGAHRSRGPRGKRAGMRSCRTFTRFLVIGLFPFTTACSSSSSGGGVVGTAADGGASGDDRARSCAEPASCPGIDRSKTPEITCLSPNEAAKSAAFTLHLFGRYLQDSGGATTKVSFDGPSVAGGNVLNGVPVSPCHVTVEVPAGFLAGAGPVKVYAITASQSPAFELAIK